MNAGKTMLAVVAILGACGSNKKPENPFGPIDDRMLALLHDECPMIEKQTKQQITGDESASQRPDVLYDSTASAFGVRILEDVELSCPPDANGDSAHVGLAFDTETRQAIEFRLSYGEANPKQPHPRIERMLTRFVDPWVKVASPDAIRKLISRADDANELRGSYWYIDGGTSVVQLGSTRGFRLHIAVSTNSATNK